MAALYHSIFTGKGLELLREAIQTGAKLGITHMSFGDGGGSLPTPDAKFTQMVNEVYRVQLNRLAPSKDNPNWLEADGIIPSAIGGFNIREVGLWAGDVMVAYANYPPTYKPSGDQGTAQIKTIRIVLQIDNTANFELKIDASIVMATLQYVEDAKEEAKKYSDETKIHIIRSINELLNLDISDVWNGRKVSVLSYHDGLGKGGGYFVYSSDKKNINNGVTIFNGWVREKQTELSVYDAGVIGVLNEEDYNDHDALRRLADLVTSDTTTSYIIDFEDAQITVGRQTLDTTKTLQTQEHPFRLDFSAKYGAAVVNKKIIIKANGAKIVTRSGLRIGVFKKDTLEPYTDITYPFYPGTASYNAIKDSVVIYNSLTHIYCNFVDYVSVSGFIELDGNSDSFIVGGGYGDKDWQLGGLGLQLIKCNKHEASSIYSHHHTADGFYLSNNVEEGCYAKYSNLIGYYNGRQGCSLTGGKNIAFKNCDFRHNGISTLKTPSSPRSNLDIEAESNPISNVLFEQCAFVDAGYDSIVSDTGNVSDIYFRKCEIANYRALWITKPRFVFEECSISGTSIKLYGTDEELDRTRFLSCTWDDLLAPNTNGYLITATNGNPIFEKCSINCTKSKWFWSTRTSITKGGLFSFKNCSISLSLQNSDPAYGAYIFENVTIIDSRPDPTLPLTVYLATIWLAGLSVWSPVGESALAFSLVQAYNPLPTGVLNAKNVVGYPNITNNLELYKNIHVLGNSTTLKQSSINKLMFAKTTSNFPTNSVFYNVGDIIFCVAPLSTSYVTHWICTAAGYYNTSPWSPSTAYANGTYVNSNGNVYQCTTAGSSGTVSPNHTNGTANDGTVTWTYIGSLATFISMGGSNQAYAQTFANTSDSSSSSTGSVVIAGGLGVAKSAYFGATVAPNTDNLQNLGTSSKRWSSIYAGTGTIQTSDKNYKQEIAVLDEAEKRIALQCKSLIRKFKFKDAYNEKGQDARLHFGVIAQEVKAAFEAEGLNGFDYGVLCFDQWEAEYEPIYAEREVENTYYVVVSTYEKINEKGEAETVIEEIRISDAEVADHTKAEPRTEIIKEEYDTGEKRIKSEAGSRYSIRYDELAMFILAAL
ncbi:TPA: phage tail protein [Acinetobacter baumannii]|uniref:phage tail-collar fiber domain-containing protein n=1 Tax=Acinetobacter baumannii TaxID=470 RepID=UPI000671D0EC|nr:phage tail protein [Acinetobacter baumannii]KMV03800.1 carbohydrate binding domain protein [Acinetobacter baumannii]HAV6084187.1 hypothetical protein [Acinetobacter baumannii]HAV6102560.1 hypothetical protein [Acinetobacter baumannii]HAV6108723.1 hypothetical protein [Acinetobacter baumannii]